MDPVVKSKSTITQAWAAVLEHFFSEKCSEISPLIINIQVQDGEPVEEKKLRVLLDRFLSSNKLQSIETVANTIFPESLWKISRGDRKRLFKLYDNNLLRYKKLEPSKNKCGLYFERLTSFGDPENPVNQLEFIIGEFNDATKSRRRSKYQAVIFDPRHDHKSDPYLGFPCLDHISFVPTSNGLVMNAIYAKQLLVKKAYGNLLGLYRLGTFMAKQMKSHLITLNCIVGVEELDFTKTKLNELSKAALESLKPKK